MEEVNEAVLPPRVQPLPRTSADVLFNTSQGGSVAGAPTVGAPAPLQGPALHSVRSLSAGQPGEGTTGAGEQDHL